MLASKTCYEALRARDARFDGLFFLRAVFDLDSNPTRIAEHLGQDKTLRALVTKTPGLRVPGAWDAFEITTRAVLGQQVSVAGATTLSGRLVARFGTPLTEAALLRRAEPWRPWRAYAAAHLWHSLS